MKYVKLPKTRNALVDSNYPEWLYWDLCGQLQNNLNGQHVCRGRRRKLSLFDVDKSYLRWYYSAQEIEETKTEEKLGQSSNFHIWPRVTRKGQVTAALIANLKKKFESPPTHPHFPQPPLGFKKKTNKNPNRKIYIIWNSNTDTFKCCMSHGLITLLNYYIITCRRMQSRYWKDFLYLRD